MTVSPIDEYIASWFRLQVEIGKVTISHIDTPVEMGVVTSGWTYPPKPPLPKGGAHRLPP